MSSVKPKLLKKEIIFYCKYTRARFNLSTPAEIAQNIIVEVCFQNSHFRTRDFDLVERMMTDKNYLQNYWIVAKPAPLLPVSQVVNASTASVIDVDIINKSRARADAIAQTEGMSANDVEAIDIDLARLQQKRMAERGMIKVDSPEELLSAQKAEIAARKAAATGSTEKGADGKPNKDNKNDKSKAA